MDGDVTETSREFPRPTKRIGRTQIPRPRLEELTCDYLLVRPAADAEDPAVGRPILYTTTA